MSRPVTGASYRAVLRLPGALHAFVFAMLGRLSYGTVSLSLLFTIQRATGSFAVAGGTISVFGVTSLVMPIKARLIDRYGQSRVLTPLGTGYAAVLSGVCVLAVLTDHHAAGYLLLAAAAGLTAPPLGPSMRALWAALAHTAALRQRAYSLDSVIEQGVYMAGPVLVGALIAVATPALALAVTAALALTGTVGLASSPAARSAAAAVSSRARRSPLRHAGFVVVLVAVLALGSALAAVDLGVAARAQRDGTAAAAGYLLAGLSLGSALGGLAWGHFRHRRTRSTQLAALVSVLAVGVGLAAHAPNLPVLGVVLAATGLAVAPVFIVAYLAADHFAQDGARTEATTWINTVYNLGAAAGAAGAGALVDQLGPSATLIAGATVLTGPVLVVLLARRRTDEANLPSDGRT